MRRRTALILAGLVVLVSAGTMLGGAATSQARPRVIDPFTLSASPSPAQLSTPEVVRHVTFTIAFANASGHAINQGTFEGAVSAGAFEGYTASRGTCAGDPNDAKKVTCNFGHLEADAQVTASFRYSTPLADSGLTSESFSGRLLINERGGDPGSTSIFFPTPNPVTVPLEAQSKDKVIDALDVTGGSIFTAGVTSQDNDTSTALTTPATGAFEPVSIEEVATQSACGSTVDQLFGDSMVSAPGDFGNDAGGALKVILDLRASGGNVDDVVGCHNGAPLPDCPSGGSVPDNGCLLNRDRLKNANNVAVFRLTMLGRFNGNWGGGF